MTNTFSFKLTDEQQAKLEELLRTGNYKPATVPHTRIAVKGEDCSINLYNSGKLLIQGKGAADFVEFVIEPQITETVTLGYEADADPKASEPHMGIDESGKGDYFGPLVVAAAYVDSKFYDQLESIGVKDSKRITSDKKALAMGRQIRQILNNHFVCITVSPKRYNELYSKIRSLNKFLAWGHAKAIENLLEKVPECPRALSDQFGKKSDVTRSLQKRGKEIVLEQRHKAESDLAVAAASIIAREQFLRHLEQASKTLNVTLPKGASAQVKDIAESLVKTHGAPILAEIAKCHFKTTDAVLARTGHTRDDLPDSARIQSRGFVYKSNEHKGDAPR